MQWSRKMSLTLSSYYAITLIIIIIKGTLLCSFGFFAFTTIIILSLYYYYAHKYYLVLCYRVKMYLLPNFIRINETDTQKAKKNFYYFLLRSCLWNNCKKTKLTCLSNMWAWLSQKYGVKITWVFLHHTKRPAQHTLLSLERKCQVWHNKRTQKHVIKMFNDCMYTVLNAHVLCYVYVCMQNHGRNPHVSEAMLLL